MLEPDRTQCGRLLLRDELSECAQKRLRIEAEELRVLTEEAPRVGAAGKTLELLALERSEIRDADVRRLFGIVQPQPEPLAGFTQRATDLTGTDYQRRQPPTTMVPEIGYNTRAKGVSTKVLAYVATASMAAAVGFHASARPLDRSIQNEVIAAHAWSARCPVPLTGLRVLTVIYRGFDGQSHAGQLIVNEDAVRPLTLVFRRLYAIRFPIRHMQLTDTYGPRASRPADGDFTASFECRQASTSPCTSKANRGTGSWSQHAYGEAIDLNPVENPYVGCGMTRDKASLSYLDRNRLRRGMVTPAVVRAFQAVGWGWGGSWSGTTKDYMHFSADGH